MRIIQIIDSLEPGGAECMAVNYANALVGEIDFSGLVVTRKEGVLKQELDDRASYLFLNKKKTFDVPALIRLRHFVKKNKVAIVQAHSTSFFLAFLLKLVYPSVRLIWHDHYGDSDFLSQRPLNVLRIATPFFSGIIAVNQKLKDWVHEKLKFNNSIYLPNFPSEKKVVLKDTVLNGIADKRIVCLANLRAQKNHFLLIAIAEKVRVSHPEWTFHLIGKDFNDGYSSQIKNRITDLNLEKNVFLYGTKNDIQNILNQSTIAILTSKSEGMPVALLEYGLGKKPVVVTRVGGILSLIRDGENGFLVDVEEAESFYQSIVKLIESDKLKRELGIALYKTITENYSEAVVLKKYLNWLAYNCK